MNSRYRDYSFDEFKNHVLGGKSTSEVSRIVNEPSLSMSALEKSNYLSKSSFSTSVINRGRNASQLTVIENDKFRVKCVEPELDVEKQLSVRSKRSFSNETKRNK